MAHTHDPNPTTIPDIINVDFLRGQNHTLDKFAQENALKKPKKIIKDVKK